ncbi:kinase-like domain-containing protein [Aspergillus karnatakaensis]|uniref:kinase-like domain-containing protein n=1 Tax=Aspergillus karnatakaensis TaxID=1810916 RepID=UPI003CCE074E
MESPTVLVKRIQLRLNQTRINNVNYKKFIPRELLFDALEEVKNDITQLVKASLPLQDVVEVVNVIFSRARKVFAILILIDQVQYIRNFIHSDHLQGGDFDHGLPFEFQKLKKIIIDDYAAGWFWEKQWELCPPIFGKGIIPRSLNGRVVLPYVEQNPVGGGGFGSVYQVKFHPSFHPKGFEDVDEFVRKEQNPSDTLTYENEVRVLSTLRSLGHPNILRLVACYTYEKKHNLVSPFIPGGTLRDFLKRAKSPDLNREKMFCMMAGLASAIWALHLFTLDGEKEPLYKGHHQDLWGDNILFDGERFILADFGLSSIKKMSENTPTRHKGRKGYYQAPECAELSAPYREYKAIRASDIFALGCILTELLVYLEFGPEGIKQFRTDRKYKQGQIWFKTFHRANKRHGAVHGWLRKVSDIDRRESTVEVVRLIKKMIELSPEDRPRADEVSAIMYVCAIKAFSEKIHACFAQFDGFHNALVEKARFSSWTLSQDPMAYIKSSGATAVEKEFTAVVGILTQMVETLKSIGHSQDVVDHRSFFEIRPLNLQLFNKLSPARREQATSKFTSMLLEISDHDKSNFGENVAQFDIGYSDIISKTTTKDLVAKAENGTYQSPETARNNVHTITEQILERASVGQFKTGTVFYNNQAVPILVFIETIKYYDPLIWDSHVPRIYALCELLKSEDVLNNFCIPPFYGVRERRKDWAFDVVYRYPTQEGGQRPRQQPISLYNLLLERNVRHGPLESRLKLAANLAEALASFHDVKWYHKDLTSSNIVFFPSSQTPSVITNQPYLVGFQHSRRAAEDSTEGPLQDLTRQRYYDPLYVSAKNGRFTEFRSSFDRYRLGIVLLEIGFWSPIDVIMAEHKEKDNIAFWSLILAEKIPELAFFVGDRYADIVRQCLTQLEMEADPTGYTGGMEPSSNVFFRQAVVGPLQALATPHVQLQTRNNKRKMPFEDDGHGATRGQVKHGRVSTLPSRSW